MSVGVTGTREGMTPLQLRACVRILHDLSRGSFRDIAYDSEVEGYNWLMHGDCIGADAQAWAVAAGMDWITIAYPGAVKRELRAFTSSTMVHEPQGTLERNRLIVEQCDLLLAFPKEPRLSMRGGTWYTINYAYARKRRMIVVWPDGWSTTDLADVAGPRPEQAGD